MTIASEKHLKDGPKTAKNPQISTTSCLTVPPLLKNKKRVHGPHVLCARVLRTQQQKYQDSNSPYIAMIKISTLLSISFDHFTLQLVMFAVGFAFPKHFCCV